MVTFPSIDDSIRRRYSEAIDFTLEKGSDGTYYVVITLPGGTKIKIGADEQGRDWNCWKKVVHEEDPTDSGGRSFQKFIMRTLGIDFHDLMAHPNVKGLRRYNNEFYIENIFEETFRLDIFEIDGKLAGHCIAV